MLYIDSFRFPDADEEFDFIIDIKRTCYDSFYPFKVLSKNGLERLDFEPITVLYGGNGSGKTTALNVIAEKLQLPRDSVFNQSNFLPDYLKRCHFTWEEPIPESSRIITSDDVFDYLLNVRRLNKGIDEQRENLFEEYLEAKHSKFVMTSMADYDQLKKVNSTRSKTQSKFVRSNLMDNVRGFSNGESAFKYFTEKMSHTGLYLLDEPENSLSPNRQIELAQVIEDLARYEQCQFIISSHSPFLLAMKGAKIYDLDAAPVDVKRWTDLSNVRAYYEFFNKYGHEF